MDEVSSAFDAFEQEAVRAIEDADDLAQLEQVRILYLGKKKGRLNELQKLVGQANPADRPIVGKRFNSVKVQVNHCLLYTSPSPRDVEESRMPSSA